MAINFRKDAAVIGSEPVELRDEDRLDAALDTVGGALSFDDRLARYYEAESDRLVSAETYWCNGKDDLG